ncbi:hypothetical protein BG003_006298 [Podila horticola]|nr:hypothetical protein BG003_006298 [Podila horticola]
MSVSRPYPSSTRIPLYGSSTVIKVNKIITPATPTPLLFPPSGFFLPLSPRTRIQGLLKAMYEIGDATELPGAVTSSLEDPSMANDSSSSLFSTLQCWPIDYLSYVRHFNTQDQNGQSVLADLVVHIEMAPRLKSYVEEHKLAEIYAALALKIDRGWGNRDDYKEDPTTVDFLKLNINREATWALCCPILEQLQSIVILLSDISRYLDSISRLSSLSVVIFKPDEQCDVDNTVTGEEEILKLRILKEKRKQDLETAVKFVQLHTGMFRTLKKVLCPTDHFSWQFTPQSCPEEYLERMLECLPTLIDPTELVNENWKQFVSKAERTNLTFVKKIDIWDKEAILIHCTIRRPKWTWDWHLGNLSSLELTVEFAFQFQFRMLQGTPNLRDLYLSIYSTAHSVERVLTKDDFTISQLQDQGQEDDADSIDISNSSVPNTTSPKDPNNRIDLRSQSIQTLLTIQWYLVSLKSDASRPLQRRELLTPDYEPPSEHQIQFIRESIMFRSLRDRLWIDSDARFNYSNRSSPKKDSSEEVAKVVHKIEALVDQANLQPELEATLVEMQLQQSRRQQEEQDLKRYRAEHPDHLVMPSVEKLELYGCWKMSDEVLEILLGRVFRNLRQLDECLTEGYSFDSFIRVTQSMPRLRDVHSIKQFDPASLSDGYKLRPHLTFRRRPPYMNDSRTRVGYRFCGNQIYSLDFVRGCFPGAG